MELYLIGHEHKYAVEQMLLTLYPEERPVYPAGKPRGEGDRAVLRALHYYEDDHRAVLEAAALERGDFDCFLLLVNESGLSSQLHLQNIWSVNDTRQQAVEIALTVGRELLAGEGAIRVHGGGFAGTIQAWVPNEMVNGFKTGMEAVLGEGKCHILHIRPVGGTVVVM